MASRTTEERDYQDLLRVTQSMLGDMKQSMSDISAQSDGRNRKLRQQTDITKEILDSVNDIADVERAINAITRQQTSIGRENYGINERLKNTQLAQLDAVKSILKAAKDTEKVFAAVNDVTSEVANNFTSGIDNIMGKLEGIPILGKALSNIFQPFADKTKSIINKTADNFGRGFKTAFLQARVNGSSFTQSLSQGISGGVQGMRGMVSVAGKLLAAINPIVLAVIAIGLAALAGFQRFKELDSAAKSVREETSLLNSQTLGIRDSIKSVSTEFAGLGVSAEDVGKSITAFTNEFDGLQQPSKEVLGSMVALNKNFGIGTKEASELNKVFQNIGGLSAEQSQFLIGQTTEMAKMAGVAPQQVIKDMADNSETAYKYFNGSPKALAQAAVQAAKLGTSIKQAGEVADNLLDFETSITAELEASAILGTNLNLSQARYLAANGKVVEAQQAVLDQVANLGDLTKLNTYEQKALADATGMSMSDLINQQRIREQFGKLDEKQLASANALMAAGKDITSLSKEDLDLQTKRMASQEEMQSIMDKMQNTSSAIGTAFMDMFEPVTSFVMPVLSDLFTILSAVLLPIFRVIGIVFKTVFKPLKAIYDIISAIVMPLVAIGSAIIDAMLTPFDAVFDAIEPLFLKITEFKDVMMKFAQPIIGVFAGIGKVVGSLVGGAVGYFVNFLISGLGSIFDIIVSVGNAITTYLVNPIMNVVNAIGGAFSSIGSFLGMGGDTTTSQSSIPAIDDGVIQGGNVISTNPADTIFATKNPQDLANSVAGNGIDMSALVTKMDEMIQAVSANRDVYMDREKVSSAVVRTNEKSGENRFGLMGA
jgi:hypothetical protein